MILIAGASTRAVLESARQAGVAAMAVDFFADGDAQWLGTVYSLTQDFGLALNTRNLLKAARRLACSEFVYASGPEHFPDELRYWQKKGMLCGNTAETVQAVRDPWQLQAVLSELGFTMPLFYPCTARVDGFHPDELPVDRPYLLKPLHRGGGSGIVMLPQDRQARHMLLQALPHPERYIIQAYCEGVPASVTFLADGREAVVLGTSRQLLQEGTGSFTYIGNIVPLARRYWEPIPQGEAQLAKIAAHLTQAFFLRGINTLDFLLTAEGIRVLEVNPRWSGSVELLERQRGAAFFPYHCDPNGVRRWRRDYWERMGSSVPVTPNGFWGKAILYASETLSVREDLEIPSLMEQGLRDIPSPGTQVVAGQPLCTVIAQGETEEDCCCRLREKSVWAPKILLHDER